MKLALVGVGPWGRLLARKLGEAGATVAAHVRASGPQVEGLGQRLELPALWDGGFDGVIAAAPPDATLAVATQAAAAGLAVLATKPLRIDHPLALTRPFFVDHVRLWSPCYLQLKERVAGRAIRAIRIDFCGNGPLRSFSGLDDYGPHALAFVHDLLGCSAALEDVDTAPVVTRADGATLHGARARLAGAALEIRVGNGAQTPCRQLDVEVERSGTLTYLETPAGATLRENGITLVDGPQDPLATMAHEFLDHCRQGIADPRHVRLSVAVTRSLRDIAAAH